MTRVTEAVWVRTLLDFRDDDEERVLDDNFEWGLRPGDKSSCHSFITI